MKGSNYILISLLVQPLFGAVWCGRPRPAERWRMVANENPFHKSKVIVFTEKIKCNIQFGDYEVEKQKMVNIFK